MNSHPRGGDIVAVNVGDAQVRVLLDGIQHYDSDDDLEDCNESIWTGWIVSTDISYASQWDVVLKTGSDGDTLMVHAWNPVTLRLADNQYLLVTLENSDLIKVRSVFTDYLTGEFPHDEKDTSSYNYGELCARRTTDGLHVTTGPPMASYSSLDEATQSGDQRVQFWQEYANLAMQLREAAISLTDTVEPQVQPSVPRNTLTGLLIELVYGTQPVPVAAAGARRHTPTTRQPLATVRNRQNEDYPLALSVDGTGHVFLSCSPAAPWTAIRIDDQSFKLEPTNTDDRCCFALDARYVRLAAEANSPVALE